ncbi:MAG: hypothetical protein VKM98_01915 [Cyanobacteriota bacterium]|nr:hypothetical protein [Cyanobacteriota bacterium]
MSHPKNHWARAVQQPILWIHGEALGPGNPALQAHPGRPAVFVFDTALIESNQLSLKRLGFLYECLLELPVTIRRGDVAAEVLAFAARHRADGVITTAAVDPRFTRLREAIATQLPVVVLAAEPFVELADATPEQQQGRPGPDLKRFSRYWKLAEPLIWKGFTAAD